MSRSERVQEILLLAAELPPSQIDELLKRECAGDASLRAEVESLLRSLSQAGRFLAAPTVDEQSPNMPDRAIDDSLVEGRGTRIGPYRLLERIGEGGFGTVFMAEQEEPVRRKVALKIIKLGMDTGQVVARFEQERQALAMMEHSNIARVFDAGATATGRPYFVMELVKGDPIIDYCDKNSLSIPERLELFAQVCAAVQHAHTKGIIHRDLKPSNILASTQDGRPHAKIIDFGIAKATEARLTEKTLFTEHRQLIGTPLYMSPEQAEGNLDIDTRTDVYSLGVLLYELLTGTTPFNSNELRAAAHAEIQRIIREVDPPKPSTRLSRNSATLASVALHRRTQPAKLGAMVRGELDWVVMKALEKDRGRRYESARSLETDVRRYLSGDAVSAAPPSRAYRVRKFVSRHKGPVAAVAAVALALLLGLFAFAWQARIARHQRDAAEQARAEAKNRADELQRVSDFQGRMLAQIDPERAGKELWDDVQARFDGALKAAGVSDADRTNRAASLMREMGVVNSTDVAAGVIDRTILAPSVREVETQFKDQPAVEATLRYSLATLYETIGLYDKALPLAESAVNASIRVRGADHEYSINARELQARLLEGLGKVEEAVTIERAVLDSCRRKYAADHEQTLNTMSNLGNSLRMQGNLAHAEPLLRGALDGRRRAVGSENRLTLISLNTYGYLLLAQHKLAEAEPYWREAYETGRRVFGKDDADVLIWTANMGGLLRDMGKFEESARLYRESVDGFRKVRGDTHPLTTACLSKLVRSLHDAQKTAEAEKVLLELLDAQRRTVGKDDPVIGRNLTLLAADRMLLGRMDEARAGFEEAIAILRKAAPDGSAQLADALWSLGKLHMFKKRPAEALPLFEEAASIGAKHLPADSPDIAKYRTTLAECRSALGE